MVIAVNLKEDIRRRCCAHSSMREERVIKLRFGLEDGGEHTLEEVGQSFQVTRERIRQIEANEPCASCAIPQRSRKLKAFVDGD